ncbi:MAG: nitrate reductase [Verrucomicrobia bacterium]|nr:nitrate reductase [Verrucomicrobiota bacterium]
MLAIDPTLLALHARTGPMTSELVRVPAAHGLGLPQVPARLAPASTVSSVCGFCATGCSLQVHLAPDGQALNLAADPAYPVNLGMACPKGWEALTPLAAPDRATVPLLRDSAKIINHKSLIQNNPSPLQPTDWPTAAATFAARFKAIQAAHGPHSIACLSTGQIPTEEMAFLGAFFKFGMGALHLDSNTRQCMATAATAYKQSFGFDAPPYTYADFEHSDCLVFVGSNPAIAHPIMWQRVMMNKNAPRIIVLDPRRTETAAAATDHVSLRPKSDLWLLYAIAHVLLAEDRINRPFIENHTTGFAEFAAFLVAYSPERAAPECGIPADEIRRLARLIADAKAASFWWTMGVNQGHESTRTAQALINLALITGGIGRPGTGANSITGQCNAMGSRLFANATSLLGGRDFKNPAHREHVARLLEIPAERIPTENSWAYDQIIDGIESGAIKGLWVVATNPAHSWIDSSRFARVRRKLEFLVVQDMYSTTDTARLADLVLPAAGWGEKTGFFINSERRLGRIAKVARPPGQALSDFAIFQLLARAWGCAELFRAWTSPEAVFQILKKLSAGQPCDITGIRDHAHLAEKGGIQWPYPASPGMPNDQCPMPNSAAGTVSDHSSLDIGHSSFRAAEPAQERRLFADGKFFTANQRAVILFDAPRPLPEPPCADYPFLLNTGRGSSAQWHTGTRTDKSDVLRKLAPRSLIVEIHPADAARLGIADASPVSIRSRRGEARATAVLTATVQPGQLFAPMHFEAVNRLTYPAFDPHSRQPSYKACAVRISAATDLNQNSSG